MLQGSHGGSRSLTILTRKNNATIRLEDSGGMGGRRNKLHAIPSVLPQPRSINSTENIYYGEATMEPSKEILILSTTHETTSRCDKPTRVPELDEETTISYSQL